MIQKLFLVIIGVVLLSSCAHAPQKVKSQVNDMSIKLTGTVMDNATLIKGGTFGLAPFKAGPFAEANDELDRVSSMVIKGVIDSFNEQQSSSLTIIDNSQGQPTIALEGYVEELSKTGKLSRMMMHLNRSTLKLSGDLWLTSNGKRLLEFSVSYKFDPKKLSVQDVAYRMGQEIGKFIVYNTAKE